MLINLYWLQKQPFGIYLLIVNTINVLGVEQIHHHLQYRIHVENVNLYRFIIQ